jgi:hypothetical protein
LSRWSRLRPRRTRALFDEWGYLGLERLLDEIEGHIRLLILLLILSVFISVALFVLSLALGA